MLMNVIFINRHENGWFMLIYDGFYPLVNLQKTMENHNF